MKSNTNYKTLVVLLFAGIFFIAGCKKSSIDSSLLIGKWTGLNTINRHTKNPNNTFTGIDTGILNNDTILFSTGGQFSQIRFDTTRGVQSINGTYTVSGNTVSVNYPSNNTIVSFNVISLTPRQFVFQSSTTVDPEDFISSTVTYIR